MESRTIQLTEAAHKHGNLNIRPCGKEFFPPDVFGASSKKEGLGNPITLFVEGLPEPIKTDIPTDKKTEHPRWMFRERAWVKQFISTNHLAPGDTISITRLDEKKYKIIPNNHNPKVIKEERSNIRSKIPKKIVEINYNRICDCPKNHINCLPPKEWLKCQLGVWQFTYEGRDVRNKKVHTPTFPIALARKVIELFVHKGELLLDSFFSNYIIFNYALSF
jgi:hypothetical protein